jgi:eukaryotic-like serine/threonine-protein kinase
MSSDRIPTTAIKTVPDFLEAVGRSGVLTDHRYRELRSRARGDRLVSNPSEFAGELVRDGILTEFQSSRLLAGRISSLVIGRYTLIDRIGTGAMGRVYKARHQLMDRVVALKVISPKRVREQTVVARFLREMKLVGMLDHPNVVRAYDAGLEQNTPYIVMEFLTGETLEVMLQRRGALPWSEVMDFIAQAAWGLAHAHDRGVLHHDIKPSNLLLDAEGTIKILDLGLGGFVETFGEVTSARGVERKVVAGTADYMSPERISGSIVDARADLYSLGCTIYRLLSGTYPFSGQTEFERLLKRLDEVHIPLREVRPGLPPGLIDVVDRLLAPAPEDRYASAAETAEALEIWSPRKGRAKPRGHADRSGSSASLSPAGPDLPPLNASLIEAALQPKEKPASSARPSKPSRVPETRPPLVEGLDLHRKSLEEEGHTSGREVHRQYYAEIAQVRRASTQAPEPDSTMEATALRNRWLDRLGEHLADFLADRSITQVLLLVVGIVIVVVLGLALALAIA